MEGRGGMGMLLWLLGRSYRGDLGGFDEYPMNGLAHALFTLTGSVVESH